MSAFQEDSIFHDSDEKSRPEAVLLQEMFPALRTELLVEILKYNQWNVEAGMDAALAWSAANEQPEGEAGHNGRSTPDGDVSSQIWRDQDRDASSSERQGWGAGAEASRRGGRGPSSSYGQPRSYLESSSEYATPSRTQSHANRRRSGSRSQVPRILLSQNFLVPPRFRLSVKAFTDTYTDYSVLFNRVNSHLGLTIASTATYSSEFDAEITIKEVAMPDTSAGATTRGGEKKSNTEANLDVMLGTVSHDDGPDSTGDGRRDRRGRPARKRMLHLGYDAGVKVNDVLLGIDDVTLGPGTEISQVLTLLEGKEQYVTLHFRRRRQEAGCPRFHPWASLLLEQNVVSEERADYVTKCLKRIKRRVSFWDTGEISENADKSFGATCGVDVTKMAGSGVDDRGINRRRSLGGEMFLAGERSLTEDAVDAATSTGAREGGHAPCTESEVAVRDVKSQNLVRNVGSGAAQRHSLGPSLILLPTKRLRPVLATRIKHAEEDTNGHMLYVIWVMDVKSSTEWVIRRRFSEFFQFRDVLLGIRSSIKAIEFPPKRFSNASEDRSIVDERLHLLHKFLRKVCSLICVNSLHPTTEDIHLAVQDFLAVSTKVDTISSTEHNQALQDGGISSTLQVYAHCVMQMAVVDRILDSFLDPFLIDATEDVRRRFTSDSAKEVLYDLRDFMNNFHGLLYEGLASDLSDIFEAALVRKRAALEAEEASRQSTSSIGGKCHDIEEEGRENARRTLLSEYLSKSGSVDSTESVSPPSPGRGGGGITTSGGMPEAVKVLEKQKSSLCNLSVMSEDDQKTLFRQILRRQVEIEVYMACSQRVNNCMQEAFSEWEMALQRQMLALETLPQTFFGIPVEMISPSSWDEAVHKLKGIRDPSLPHDRLAHLIEVCKLIPSLHAQEHAKEGGCSVFFGADVFLPIFIYVLVRARPPHLLTLHEEMLVYVDPERKMGEGGYYLASLEAAISHVREVDPSSGGGMFSIPVESASDDSDSDSDTVDEAEAIYTPV